MSDKIKELCNNKPAAIFGKGVSALCAKGLLDSLGIGSVLYSENAADNCPLFDESAAKKHSLVVYSPAFRPDHKWVELARKNGSTLLCEPDLASLAWQGDIIAISGTNGKTTTTSFLAKALNEAGINAVAAGNIGIPLSKFCVEKSGGVNCTAVCELSSFQLMGVKYMSPVAYVWTNFDQDHLDWHTDMREYFDAKFGLVKMLKKPVFIAGQSVADYAQKYGVALPDFAEIVQRQSGCPKPFDNNIQSENYCLAKALFKKLGLGEEILKKAAQTFSLAKYRFATSGTINGITFINDSKGTNAHSTIAAINALKGKPIIWIGGGKNKKCDLSDLADTVAENCKCVFLIGQSAALLEPMFTERHCNAKTCATLKEAVCEAYRAAKSGDYVLFSPAFSSFGMFDGYAHRGKCFDEELLSLKIAQKGQV